MRPPFPQCETRPGSEDGRIHRWAYRGASIVAGGFTWGDGRRTWEVWYAEDRNPTPHQTARQIARRLGVTLPDAVPAWLL